MNILKGIATFLLGFFISLAIVLITIHQERSSLKNKEFPKKEIAQFSYKDSSYIQFDVSGGTFDLEATIIISRDYNKVLDTIKTYFDESADLSLFRARGFVLGFPGYKHVMWLPDIPKDSESMSVANHELMHLTLYIMKWAGVVLSDDSEEVFGYTMQHLSKQFYENIK